MERIFDQINVAKLKLNKRTTVLCAELVNAIWNIRTRLKRDNIIKHVMIMIPDLPDAVTIWSFIGTSLVCNGTNIAESCVIVIVDHEACATRLCSHTFSVGLILEPREGWGL